MSEIPELDDGEDKSPDADHSSIDWLEELADDPEAIWGSAPADSGPQKTPAGGTDAPEAVAPEQSDLVTNALRPASERQAQNAARLEPTVESLNPTTEQIRSLVRTLVEGDSGAETGPTVEKAEKKPARGGETPAGYSSGEVPAAKVARPPDVTPATTTSEQAEQDIVDYGEEKILEIDDLMWLDDMEKMPEMKRNLHEDDASLPANEGANSAPGDSESENLEDAVPTVVFDANLDQVPDDPDEAIAWLERLAARQGARAEELPTVESAPDQAHIAGTADPGMFDLGQMDAGEIPEDPDEAMAWLEMLAAKEVANKGEEGERRPDREVESAAVAAEDASQESQPTAEALSADLDEALEGSLPSGLDEALDWLEELTIEPQTFEATPTPDKPLPVVEEPPTPAVPHHVDEALAGAELLFAEPGAGEAAAEVDHPVDELQYDEADDAMAWLEQLAARQGAPIEELTTLDAEPDELALELAAEDAATVEDEAVETPPLLDRIEVGEELVPEPEEPSGVAEDETLAQPEDLIEESVLEAAGTEDMTLVDLPAGEQALEELTAIEEEELEIEVEPEAPAGDLAWLDTLGAVDAQKWLEAEAAEQEEEIVAEIEPAGDSELPDLGAVSPDKVGALFGSFPDVPGSEELAEARREMQEGNFDESLARYEALVEQGQFLAFLIDDLEVVSEQRGPKPVLQRVLGDAYARNGQLMKALESYREALANL